MAGDEEQVKLPSEDGRRTGPGRQACPERRKLIEIQLRGPPAPDVLVMECASESTLRPDETQPAGVSTQALALTPLTMATCSFW
mgnify:CR=1 FL=1